MAEAALLIRRLRTGVAAHGATQASQIVARFVEIPLLVAAWGPHLYGEYLILAALAGAFAFSDLGITRAARRSLAIQAAQRDFEGVSRTFASALVVLLCLGAVAIGLFAFVFAWFPLFEILGISSFSRSEAIVSASLLGLQAQALLLCGLFHGLLSTKGLYARGELCIAAALFLGFIGLVSGAVLGASPVFAASGSLLGFVLGLIWIVRETVRVKSLRTHVGIRAARLSEISRLVTPSLASLALPLSEAINTHGARIAVGAMLSPSALVIFTAGRTLARTAVQPVLAIAKTIEPEIGLAFGRGDREAVKWILLRGVGVAFAASVILSIFVAVLAPYFVPLWIAGIDVPSVLIWWLLLAGVINVLWVSSMSASFGTGAYTACAGRLYVSYGLGSAVVIALATYFGRDVLATAVAVVAVEFIVLITLLPPSLASGGCSLREWMRGLTVYDRAATHAKTDKIRASL